MKNIMKTLLPVALLACFSLGAFAQNLAFDGSTQGGGHVQIAAEVTSAFNGVANVKSNLTTAIPDYTLRIGLNKNIDLLVVGAGSSLEVPNLHNVNFGAGLGLNLVQVKGFDIGDQIYVMKPATLNKQAPVVVDDSLVISQRVGVFRPYFGVNIITADNSLPTRTSALYGVTVFPTNHISASVESTAGQNKSVSLALKLNF